MLKPHLSPMPHRPGAPKVSGRADVIVLGAGVVGVTTAYALARRGLKVAIVDRAEGPGRGTSFANGAQLSYAYTDALGSPAMLKKLPMLALGRDPSFRVLATVDPAFLEWGLRFLRNCTNARFSRNTKAGLALALESRLAMHALTERHKFDFGHEVAGKMHLFYDRSAFAAAREVMALKRRHGAVQNALSPQEALAIEPALAGAVGLEGVIHSPEDEVGTQRQFSIRMDLRTVHGQRSCTTGSPNP
jgi:D-amino-acid dehydrogenase